jgi:hypothetical protein
MSKIYCGYCQRKLRKLVAIFPEASLKDTVFLLENGWANLSRVASFLGLERRAVMVYRKKGTIPFVKKGKFAIVSMEDLLRFALWRRRLLTMSQAARLLKVSYDTFKTLVSSGIISPDFKSATRIKYFDRRNLARKREAIQTWQSEKKTRKFASAQVPKIANTLTVKEMARILSMSSTGFWYQIGKGSLKVFRRGRFVYASRRKFNLFCQSLVDGSVGTIGFTRKKAKEYLDSIAAG